MSRTVQLKVHDMAGAIGDGQVPVVHLAMAGGDVAVSPTDDGAAPDAVRADHMYTAEVALAADQGQVTVEAGGRTWTGGFRFDAGSDPVLLVGLDPTGLAATSTHEVSFVQEQPSQAAESASAPASRPSMPEGFVAGWLVLVLAVATVGGLAFAGARRPLRAPRLVPARATTVGRGPWVPEARDLLLGPGEAAVRMGPGRWTPEELALAAMARGPNVRVVVTDPSAVEAEDPAALQAALAGVADLWWGEGG
jgi:hypothetical protein